MKFQLKTSNESATRKAIGYRITVTCYLRIIIKLLKCTLFPILKVYLLTLFDIFQKILYNATGFRITNKRELQQTHFPFSLQNISLDSC